MAQAEIAPIREPILTAVSIVNPVISAKIAKIAAPNTAPTEPMANTGMIKDNTFPVLITIILILRRITFTSFREVLLRSRPRATFAL